MPERPPDDTTTPPTDGDAAGESPPDDTDTGGSDRRRRDRGGLLPRLSVDDADEGVDRRRLIRWVAALAFAVPVVVELLTFGGLFTRRLLGDDADEGVAVGEELLPATVAGETVTAAEYRGAGEDRAYLFRVRVENGADAPVELRLTGAELADGTTVEGVSTTGRLLPGAEGSVTGAWRVGDGRPTAVTVVALRDGAVVHEGPVAVAAPA
jgi:hypothetical protein